VDKGLDNLSVFICRLVASQQKGNRLPIEKLMKESCLIMFSFLNFTLWFKTQIRIESSSIFRTAVSLQTICG